MRRSCIGRRDICGRPFIARFYRPAKWLRIIVRECNNLHGKKKVFAPLSSSLSGETVLGSFAGRLVIRTSNNPNSIVFVSTIVGDSHCVDISRTTHIIEQLPDGIIAVLTYLAMSRALCDRSRKTEIPRQSPVLSRSRNERRVNRTLFRPYSDRCSCNYPRNSIFPTM